MVFIIANAIISYNANSVAGSLVFFVNTLALRDKVK